MLGNHNSDGSIELVAFKINDAFGFFSILASNGVVLAAEKKQKSILFDDSTINKVEMVTKSIGMVYSGMGPDYRFSLIEFFFIDFVSGIRKKKTNK